MRHQPKHRIQKTRPRKTPTYGALAILAGATAVMEFADKAEKVIPPLIKPWLGG